MKIQVVREKLFQEIDSQTTRAKEKMNQYEADNRKDEAVFERIKINVYEIFRKMYQVSEKKALSQGDVSEQVGVFKDAYMNYFKVIPSNWYESLEEAKANDDFELVHIEEMKIKTMTEIKSLFDQLWEADYE